MTCCTLFAEPRGQNRGEGELPRIFRLYSPKNYLPNFPTQKTSWNRKFKPPPPPQEKKKKLQPSLSLEIWSNPIPSWEQH